MGSGDIQSLADLGNSFEIVKGMKPVPFGKDTLLQLAVISLAPVAPLVLTMIPLGELLDRFLQRRLLISQSVRTTWAFLYGDGGAIESPVAAWRDLTPFLFWPLR